LVDDGEGEGEMVDIQPIGRGTTQAFVDIGNGSGMSLDGGLGVKEQEQEEEAESSGLRQGTGKILGM
jgi:hypothetical protein